MKKLLALAGLCTLLCLNFSTASFAHPSATRITSSEPEPHPQTILAKVKLNGKPIYLSLLVFFTDTVADTKSQVADILGVSTDEVTLSYGGTELVDELTLNDYGITASSTISVSLL